MASSKINNGNYTDFLVVKDNDTFTLLDSKFSLASRALLFLRTLYSLHKNMGGVLFFKNNKCKCEQLY